MEDERERVSVIGRDGNARKRERKKEKNLDMFYFDIFRFSSSSFLLPPVTHPIISDST